MADNQLFTLSLPSIIERNYFISPGVVSVIFKVVWSVFIFTVVTIFIQYGFASIGIKESKNKQKTIWKAHNDYTRVQNVANGRWGGMLLNLPSTRVILGFLFWLFIYVFELLFSLSINTSYMTVYNGTQCVGRVDNTSAMTDSMWYDTGRSGAQTPAKNSTLLRQLVNQKQVGNLGLLGDGIFSISPGDALYKKNQTINVARAGFNCDSSSTLYLNKTAQNMVYRMTPSGDMQIYPSSQTKPQTSDNQTVLLILLTNPSLIDADINYSVYNNSVFLSECTISFEYGQVTIVEDGYLNETNIGESYTKVQDKSLDTDLLDMSGFIIENKYYLSTIDYPDIFLNTDYNKTFADTMKIANNIVSAHLLCGLDPEANLCSFNQEQVPVYISVLGTRMSFGYILIAVIFVLFAISILAVVAFALSTNEERKHWLLYTHDWRFIGYITGGNSMDQKEFKKYAKDTYVNADYDSKEAFEAGEDKSLRSDTLLQKE